MILHAAGRFAALPAAYFFTPHRREGKIFLSAGNFFAKPIDKTSNMGIIKPELALGRYEC